jgi:hypothetical protein
MTEWRSNNRGKANENTRGFFGRRVLHRCWTGDYCHYRWSDSAYFVDGVAMSDGIHNDFFENNAKAWRALEKTMRDDHERYEPLFELVAEVAKTSADLLGEIAVYAVTGEGSKIMNEIERVGSIDK